MTPANESLQMREKKIQKLATKMESFKAKKRAGGVILNLAKKTGKFL
jgi:hypothetical protein